MTTGEAAKPKATRAGRPMRSDAVANRERVLAAAVTAILREGTSVPLSKIAKEAHVGIGTLYRRYPNRDALLEGLELRAYGLVVDLLDEIEQQSLPGSDSLRVFLERTVEHGSQLVLPYHGAPWSNSEEADRLRHELARRMSGLLHRGVDDGTLRDDLSPRDVIIFGSLIALPLPFVDDWAAATRRQIDIFLRSVQRI